MSRARVAVAAISLSAAAFVGIANHEAFREQAYDDGVGVQTIGFGTTEGVQPGDKITVERALVRALQDASKYEGALRQCVTVPLHQHEYDAAISISYNIGASAFCNSTMVKKLNSGDYQGFCDGMLQWNRAGGRVMNGLIIRRQKERALCLGQQ